MNLKSKFTNIEEKITFILGENKKVIVKRFNIGGTIKSAILYQNEISDKALISEYILKPLMKEINLKEISITPDLLCSNYILLSKLKIEKDINISLKELLSGFTVILIDNFEEYILADTFSSEHRNINEPQNESSISGSREGFVENIETNISIIKRRLKDKNLVIDDFILGERSKTRVCLLYVDDIINQDMLNRIKAKIEEIDVDYISDIGGLSQFLEFNPYSIFPKYFVTERPEIVISDVLEGKAIVMMNGTPTVLIVPSVFQQFFQSTDDYNQKIIVASFIRIIRYIALFTATSLPSIYLTIIKFNIELLPIKFIVPIIKSRKGIALSPLNEILLMEIVVEFLREGGIRLPQKIGQTLSIVGGIIIGNAALESKIVSPTTLFVIGITVVASFLNPNYNMSLSIRIIRFALLFIVNVLGILGLALGWFYIITELFSDYSFGIPYFNIDPRNFNDLLFRGNLRSMNKRPHIFKPNNVIRQGRTSMESEDDDEK